MKMKVGIVVAIKEELKPFFSVFGTPACTHASDPYIVASWNKYKRDLYVVESGYGEIAAAAATQHLIDRFDVDAIINYGVVGSLTDNLHGGDIGIVQKVVHYGFDMSAIGHPVGRYPNQKDLFLKPKIQTLSCETTKLYHEFICASADRFVDGGEEKRQLHEKYGANICEMEAAGIVLTCNKNQVPCSFLKVVSDDVNEGEQAFKNNVDWASKACVEELAKILQI